MILLTHLLLGAVIGEKIGIFWAAIVLALLSHYFLDMFPHSEYSIENIKNNQWQNSAPDFLKVATDFVLGILIISLASDNTIQIYICSLAAIIPDGLTLLSQIFKNKFLFWHGNLHENKIHFFKNKKISVIWRFLIQAVIIVVLTILLKSKLFF